jgi:two-component system, NarL family, sensor histidine kinase UhpB
VAPFDAWSAGEGVERGRDVSLLTRIFLVNAAVFIAAAATLALTPATVSSPIALREAVVLVAGLTAILLVNLSLLRRAFQPLRRLTDLMETVELLAPGRRIPVDQDDVEIVRLTSSFNAMLDRLERERRDSVKRSLAAQEAERDRIARELHDEIGQSLTALVLQIERAGRSAGPKSQEQLVEAREAARATLEEVRDVARRLRPEALDDLGLGNALATLCDRIAEHGGIRVSRQLERNLPALPPEAELVVYRVAQEALTNALRHANASRAELALNRTQDRLTLCVRDDGDGIDGAVAGAGIQGMRERALLVNGAVTLSTRREGGTEVRLDVELPSAHATRDDGATS